MEKDQISISTCFAYNIPIEEQVPIISEAGFTHISLGQNRSHFDYMLKENRRKLLKLLSKYYLRIDTIHGPEADIVNEDELTSIAEAAIALEAPVVVLHAGPFDFTKDQLDLRLNEVRRRCRQIGVISRQTGITFALENVMPGPATELVKRIILESDVADIGFCYDSSHDQIGGPHSFDLLLELRDRLRAVHLSDRVKEFVDHVIPGEGFIHWDSLCSILRASKLTFPLLLEVMIMHSSEKDPVRFLNLAFNSGRKLYHQIYV